MILIICINCFILCTANPIEELKKQLNGKLLSAVIDGSGSQLFVELPKVLHKGAIITQYGDTTRSGGINFNIRHWLRNIELKGSTMGSRVEFGKMIELVDKYKIRPVVSQSLKGLTQENFDKSISLLA